MNKIVKQVITELKKNIDKPYIKTAKGFFKEEITIYGVRYPVLRKIAKEHFKQIKDLPKKDILKLCEELLEVKVHECLVVAYQWADYLDLAKDDFKTYEKWAKKYNTNWAAVDDLSFGPVGKILKKYPDLVKKTVPWRTDKNRWVKRISAVALIPGIKKEMFAKEAIECADTLLLEQDDLLQKAYGWMLRELYDKDKKKVYNYIMKHKHHMPRTALRYAIEHMSKEDKKKCMER